MTGIPRCELYENKTRNVIHKKNKKTTKRSCGAEGGDGVVGCHQAKRKYYQIAKIMPKWKIVLGSQHQQKATCKGHCQSLRLSVSPSACLCLSYKGPKAIRIV